jgi:hypothetical protein|tara:strand:- start:3204 stop:3764 length:561 start_codon:yes stop_codon:yes gene_type:complete
MLYILVGTWNGEGYSDSSAKIIEAENFKGALEVAVKEATEASPTNKVRVFCGNTATYDSGDDSGAMHIIPFEDQYGICIFPDTNQFTVLGSQAAYNRALELSCKDKGCDADEAEEVKENNEGCIHTSHGCEIFQTLNSVQDMELLDGVGVECGYEIWKNTKTNKKYRVSIEIARDFVSMEEVDFRF